MDLTRCTQVCDCNIGFAPSGVDCTPLMAVVKKLIFLQQYDSTGAANKIDLTQALNAAYFAAFINQTDATKRWFPMPEIKDVENKRDKPVTKKYKDDSTVFVRDGIRTFMGVFPPKSGVPQLIAMLDQMRCIANNNVAVFMIDANGSFIGNLSSDGNSLYPLLLDNQSIASNLLFTTDTTPQEVELDFNFDPQMRDACLRLLTTTELVGTVNPLSFKGLFNVNLNVISANDGDNFIKFSLETDFGKITNPILVKAMVFGAFTFNSLGLNPFNTSTPLNNVTGDFVEVTPGVYKKTYAVGDALLVDPGYGIQIIPVLAGYDWANVKNTITVIV